MCLFAAHAFARIFQIDFKFPGFPTFFSFADSFDSAVRLLLFRGRGGVFLLPLSPLLKKGSAPYSPRLYGAESLTQLALQHKTELHIGKRLQHPAHLFRFGQCSQGGGRKDANSPLFLLPSFIAIQICRCTTAAHKKNKVIG